MKSLDEMTITELKALMADHFMQRDQAEAQRAQANETLKALGNLLQLRMKEEHDKSQPPAPQPPDREEAEQN